MYDEINKENIVQRVCVYICTYIMCVFIVLFLLIYLHVHVHCMYTVVFGSVLNIVCVDRDSLKLKIITYC